MKRIISLILAFAMVFLLASCSTKVPPQSNPECTEHTDSDTNGYCDTCGAAVELPEEKNNGFDLVNALVNQVTKANSLKFEFKIEGVTEEIEWYYGNDYYEHGDTTDVEKYTGYEEFVFEVAFEISRGANGVPNIKGTAKSSSRYDKADEFDVEKEISYLIDGVSYTEYNDSGVYVTEDVDTDFLEITRMLDEALRAGTLDTDNEELMGKLGDFIIAKFNIKEYKGSLSVDAKAYVTEYIDYFADLNLNTKKTSEFINDILAMADVNVTVEEILTKVEELATLTVDEAIVEIDKWLTENEGLTLQELIDRVVNDEKINDALETAYKYYTGMDMEADPSEDAEFNEFLNKVQNFNIRAYVKENGLGDIKLYDLAIELLNIDDAPSVEEMFSNVRTILDTNLAELESMWGLAVFGQIKEIASALEINRLDANVDVNFKGVFDIDTVEGDFNLDVAYSPKSEVLGKYNFVSTRGSLEFKVYDISENTLNIALPGDATVIADVFGYYHDSDNVTFETMQINLNGDTVSINVYGYDSEYHYIDIYAENLPLSILLSNSISIRGEYVEIYYDGELADHDIDMNLVILIEEDWCFNVVTVPDYSVNTEVL